VRKKVLSLASKTTIILGAGDGFHHPIAALISNAGIWIERETAIIISTD